VITHTVAAKMIEAAQKKAGELGLAASVAVVDDGGNLKAFARMDGALLGSANAARRKAYTAAVSGMSTAKWFDMVTGNTALGMILGTGMEGVLFLPGGEPVLIDGVLSGAVGVSGGQADQDAQIVDAALAQIG
jgi:uncharacterized protein GlcG (DUF336 family)